MIETNRRYICTTTCIKVGKWPQQLLASESTGKSPSYRWMTEIVLLSIQMDDWERGSDSGLFKYQKPTEGEALPP